MKTQKQRILEARQGRRLIAMLKKRGMTTMDLLMTGISTAPWKRIAECLTHEELLDKRKNARGLLVYRVVKEYKPKTVWVKK